MTGGGRDDGSFDLLQWDLAEDYLSEPFTYHIYLVYADGSDFHRPGLDSGQRTVRMGHLAI